MSLYATNRTSGGGGSGGGVTIYANLAAFPATATDGTLAVAADTHILYEYNATAVAWQPIASNAKYSGNTVDVTLGSPSSGLGLAGQVLTLALATSSTPGAVANIGAANGVATLDANALVPITQIPPAALERLVVVANQTARYALTTATVQNGDTVSQTDINEMFFVKDDTNLNNASGYAVYSAGTAAAVAWSGITSIPAPVSALTGTNSGDVTLAAIGSTPGADGASLSGQILTLQPASATFGGVLTAGVQSIAGAKTFTGAISASNLSNTNSGDVTLTAVGSSPSANGASLSGQALTLQPADGTNPGVVTAGTQTFGGAKTFSSTIGASNLSGTNTGDITVGTFGSTPTANGLSLSSQVLTLQPADGTNPGAITTGTQTIAGAKTFSTSVTSPAHISSTANPAATGIFRLANNESISWRNAANSADLGIKLDATNTFTTTNVGLTVGTGTVSATNGSFTAVSTQRVVGVNANPANAGFIRLSNNASTDGIYWRNAANGANLGMYLDGSNILQVGMAATFSGIVSATSFTGTASGNMTVASPTNHGVVISGSANAVTVTSAGTAGQVLTSNGASADPTFQAIPAFTAPTVQKFASGTAATYTTPANVKWIRVRMVGGGGGGGGSGSSGGGNGGAGGSSSFSGIGVTLTAPGGNLGTWAGQGGQGGATSSAATITGANGLGLTGGPGSCGFYTSTAGISGGNGGNSAFGGGGGGGNGNYNVLPVAANTGAGGGGAGSGVGGVSSGGGGGAGSYIDALISSPAASFIYTVGAAGTSGSAGTDGLGGGSGAAGYIIVEEHY